MQNWSGNQEWNPQEVFSPKSEEEILGIVKNAYENKRKIRIIGTGHSFTPLVCTDQILIDLDDYQGIESVDKAAKTAVVRAGTKLNLLGKQLFENGLALENMGDVDMQSIAGSISTGTHGTGLEFGNMSTQVTEVTFINGLGERVVCSETIQPELFKCMQISLGAFGIITNLKMRCIPSYKLKLEKKKEKLDDVLAKLDNINKTNRNFEFYWMPYTDTVQTKYSNISDEPEDKSTFWSNFNDIYLENYVFKGLCEVAKAVPTLNKGISSFSAQFISSSKKTQYSHNVYATPRYVKFNEMEYNVPIEAYQDVMKDLVKCINTKKFNIHFPLENRFVKGDDIYLSPAHKRNSAYIACHVYKGKEYKPYFTALEEIFMAYDGRPHWGKMHTRTADYFRKVYPEMQTFLHYRLQHDPKGLFLNPHVKEILGI